MECFSIAIHMRRISYIANCYIYMKSTFNLLKLSSFPSDNIMVKSRKFLLLSLICSGHAVFGNYIPRSLGEISSLFSATSSSSSSVHDSFKPSPSPSPSHYTSHAGTEQALTLNLTEPAIMQVVNHGSSKSSLS